jgi:hypothetical protein
MLVVTRFNIVSVHKLKYNGLVCRVRANSQDESSKLDDESHVLFVRELGLFAKPEAVVDGEGIDGDRQMFRVDLGELFATGIVSEISKKTFSACLLGNHVEVCLK